DAGVLADRPVAFGAHARVGEDLRDRVLGGRRLLALIGAAEGAYVVGGVVIGDELQRVGNALDQIGALDRAHAWFLLCCGAAGMMRSLAAIAMADRRKVMWIPTCARIVFSSYAAALMKVLSRWIEEMPMIAVASFTLSTEAFTCDSHSGWSGWLSRFMRETKVS